MRIVLTIFLIAGIVAGVGGALRHRDGFRCHSRWHDHCERQRAGETPKSAQDAQPK